MNKVSSGLVCVLFFSACGTRQQDEGQTSSSDLFADPVTIPLDSTGGYSIHPLRQDSVSVIWPNVVTGKTQSLQGVFTSSDSTEEAPRKLVMKLQPQPGYASENDALVEPVIVPFNGSSTRFKAHNKKGELGKKITYTFTIKEAKNTPVQRAGLPRSTDNDIFGLKSLDIDQGLKSSYIWCMLEDSRGHIWIAYDAGGISRYDGNNFVHFGAAEGFTNVPVYSMLEDRNGHLWFTTESAFIIRYDGADFYHYACGEEDVMSQAVWSSLEDSKGNLWFGTGANGVMHFDGRELRLINEDHGISGTSVFSLLEDEKGDIWIGTNDGGATRFDGQYFEHFGYPEGLTDECVYAMHEDDSGAIWFATNNGVYAFDGKTMQNISTDQGLPFGEVMSLNQDDHGTLWFATFGGGISGYDGKKLTNINHENGLTTDMAAYLLNDQTGHLWIGTNGGGICRFNPAGFRLYTEEEGLSVNTIWSILETQQHGILFGGLNGTIDFRNDSLAAAFGNYQTPDEWITEQIFCMLEDHTGKLWFGTYGNGLIQYDPATSTFVNYTNASGISSDNILSLHEDENGVIWIGTNGSGLVRMTTVETPQGPKTEFVNYTTDQGFLGDIVITIKEDLKHNLWIGTYDGGLTKIDQNGTTDPSDDAFYFISEKEGLPNNCVLAIHEDKTGQLWFGTNGGGLSSFDGAYFVNYKTPQGLASNQVWTILEDKENERLWVGTDNGLTVLEQPVSEMDEPYKLITFDKRDGLKGVDFVSNSGLLSSKNVFWFGTGKNLMSLDMNRFNMSYGAPDLKLQTMLINEQFFDFAHMTSHDTNGFTFSGVTTFTNCPQNLVLDYDKNHLTFDFTATDWFAPHNLKFQYKLDGLDENWSQFTSEARADYRNLSYGSYTLRVRSIGKAQNWSGELTYSFTILPPWWHTWWARLLYVIAGGWLILQLIRWRTKTLKRRQKELERTVADRTAELVKEKKEVEFQRQEAEEQRELVQEKNKEILDSINYAKRIQTAILPSARLLNEALSDYFILYKPKDIVAGDFYWMQSLAVPSTGSGTASDSEGNKNVENSTKVAEPVEATVMLAAADCTGHGVPGAMVSVVCNNALNRSVREYGLTDPGKILDKTREIVISEFEKSDENVKDGMDISLVSLSLSTLTLNWSGANNPLWILRKNATEIEEIKPNKQPIGKFSEPAPFTTHTFKLAKGDSFYIFTDGLQDQFGGDKGKKFKASNLKVLLLSVAHLPMTEQMKAVDKAFTTWRGSYEQVDDVCVIGVRV